MLDEVTASGNTLGISLVGSSATLITNSTVGSNAIGGVVLRGNSDNNSLTNNTVTGNDGNGIAITNSDGNILADNTVNNSDSSGLSVSLSSNNIVVDNTVGSNAGDGIFVDSSTNNGFFDNTIASNQAAGVSLVEFSFDNDLDRNTVESNGETGIFLGSSGNDVETNTIESNGGAGVAIENAGDISLSANVVSANDGEGIVVLGGNRSLVSNNTVTGNGRAGIALLAGAANNSIVNNVFRNDDNVDLSKRTIPGVSPFVPAGGPNTWNRSKTQGPNRAGGPFLGGNYYARTNGTGFSQTCADADGDGLCDSPNDFGNASDDNTDFLPLTGPCTFDTPGDVTGNGKVATDPDCDGFYEDANGDGTVDAVDVQAIFANRNDPAVADNPGEFDFTRNGKFNVVDVQKLFFELTGKTRSPT
jgi:parallel beta-helix repeat protein